MLISGFSVLSLTKVNIQRSFCCASIVANSGEEGSDQQLVGARSSGCPT